MEFGAFEPSVARLAGDTIIVLGRTLSCMKMTGTSFDSEWAHVLRQGRGELVRLEELDDRAAIGVAFTV